MTTYADKFIPEYPADSLQADADRLLRDIGNLTAKIKKLDADAEQELESIRKHYAWRTDPLKERLEALDKELITFMKTRRSPLFDNSDKVKLIYGILFYGKEDKVSIPRDAIEKIEAQGWGEGAIKTAKSVDRAVVEKWPEERLIMIGATKKPKRTYSYELRS